MTDKHPATVTRHGNFCTVQIDSPKGAPFELDCGESSEEIHAALEELAACVGLTIDDFYLTFAE